MSTTILHRLVAIPCIYDGVQWMAGGPKDDAAKQRFQARLAEPTAHSLNLSLSLNLNLPRT